MRASLSGDVGAHDNMKRTVIITACALVLLTQGCVMTYMAVTNAAGTPITVTSGHTGKSYRINVEQTAMIPHTAGTLKVETDDGERWEYPNVCSLSGKKTSHFLFWTKVVEQMTISEKKE